MKHHELARLLVVAVAMSVLAACTAPGSIAPPSASASPGLTASPSSAATPSAVPSVSPTETPTPTAAASTPAVAAKPLIIDWTRRSVAGLDGLAEIRATASDGAITVLLGRGPHDSDAQQRSMIWRSTDGRHWERALRAPAGQRLDAITAGGPGFVVVGTDGLKGTVWTSRDGLRWQEVFDDALDRVSMQNVVATTRGLVAFGHRWDTDSRTIWTSPDGVEWLAATNPSGLEVARGVAVVTAWGGRALAFVGAGDYTMSPVQVWATTGRAEWEHVATLPGGERLSVWRAAGGPQGWVAVGARGSSATQVAWYSADGLTWELAATGPDVSASIIGVDAGFVAAGSVGSLGDETCGDQRAFHGHTWSSADGRTWQRMAVSKDFEWASVSELMVVGRNLVGIGGSYPSQQGAHFSTSFVPTRWTAPLASVSLVGDASDRPSEPQGCGG